MQRRIVTIAARALRVPYHARAALDGHQGHIIRARLVPVGMLPANGTGMTGMDTLGAPPYSLMAIFTLIGVLLALAFAATRAGS